MIKPIGVLTVFLAVIAVVFVGAFPTPVTAEGPDLRKPTPAEKPLQVRTPPAKYGLDAGTVELLDRRTLGSKTFQRLDGSYTSIIGKQLHYQVKDQIWADIDLTLIQEGNNWVVNKLEHIAIEVNPNGINVRQKNGGAGIHWYTPESLTIDDGKAIYSDGGIIWKYLPTSGGIELKAQVLAARGQQTYLFSYAMLGGAADLEIDARGNAVSGEIVVRRPTLIGADNLLYDGGTWTKVAGSRLSMTFDDNVLPAAAFPYLIDPTTTFNIAATADDGECIGNDDASYPPAFDYCSTGSPDARATKTKHSGLYDVLVGLFRWNTGAVLTPTTIISSATFTGYMTAAASCDSRSYSADWHTWTTLGSGDFTATAGTNAIAGTAISGISASSDNTFSLSNPTTISLSGYTGLRTHISGGAPTCNGNYVNVADYSHASQTEARLAVTYTDPSAAITGTIGDGATEQEVRDGGGTILVTLTDDTWVADGATFNAQRQAIIDGLDAASSPAAGWNNEVRDSIGVASVVRTSATLATITLTASEVAGYAIASNEIITMTVPAAALTGGVALTATPTITITAGTESAAITGTIGDGATEQEVRDGGGTILITLSNTTWVAAAGSLFDNQRQNIIDGLVAADSQTYGWNNEVKAKLGVTAVVRTSGTIVTITVPAGDVEDYRIVTNEVITTTVPASAMVFGAALVATPTTTITGTVESAAVSGTLGGSGGTAAEIEAGGETVIITLTNTTWVTAGATFNAQRQNILDGLVADDSDVNGWNAMAFAVGDVVRTSGTIVTITLSAESAYAIPSAETVTTTVPASAMNYGGSLVAPETFTISPAAFATSGTRVSTAINLSSVTDLAYCAIGWETTLPTNTAVAIETSINGGSTYSTATNGNCPTGLTLGESLSSITDFRVKATLTTTDTSVTPLITALGLIVEDAGGSELCYQLLTTPSASLADSCGTYTGTMSFPIGPSTITSSTAPITSTADPLPNARSLAGQDVAQAVTGSATSARLFPAAGDEGGFVGLPLNDLVNEMSTVGDGLPVRFVWFIFLGIATIGAGMLAVHLTSNLFIAAGAMAAVMGFQMAIGSTGLLPGWILFAFIPLAAAFLLFRRGFPV